MSQWLRWDLNRGRPGYKPFSLTTGPHAIRSVLVSESPLMCLLYCSQRPVSLWGHSREVSALPRVR
ncbi:UNVERIFIED_CONTAM: hypothetical protein FKN15_023456 [Acipenser sinensis]